jgi:hypothetical protein
MRGAKAIDTSKCMLIKPTRRTLNRSPPPPPGSLGPVKFPVKALLIPSVRKDIKSVRSLGLGHPHKSLAEAVETRHAKVGGGSGVHGTHVETSGLLAARSEG